jgi:hypothetical protein
MGWQVQKLGGRWAKSAAIALALLSLVFLLQATPHQHTNGQDEAACRLCQAAHVSAIPAVSGIVFSVPLVPVGEVSAPRILAATENFPLHSDPRAPPAEALS